MSAREVVLMGCNPRLGVLQSPTAAMCAAAEEALRTVDPMLMLDWCDTLIVLQNGQVGAMLYPRTDPVEALQSALAAVYGPLELVPVTDRTGRVRLALLPL